MMELTFSPSADVIVVLNALLDIFERRATQNAKSSTEHVTRAIRITISEIDLPSYFSQLDPTPRILANEQLTALERSGFLRLGWVPGETGHLLQFATLQTEHAPLSHHPAPASKASCSPINSASWTIGARERFATS
jgi:hypothetical protein